MIGQRRRATATDERLRIEALDHALRVATTDLYKAANQLKEAGLDGVFTAKAERAERAVMAWGRTK